MAMSDQELEQKIRTAVEHAQRADVGTILAACGADGAGAPETTPAAETKEKKSEPADPFGLFTGAAPLWSAMGSLFGVKEEGPDAAVLPRPAAVSFVVLDVNPSVSLAVDAEEKVVRAEALNEDAEGILAELDLVGHSLEEAVDSLVQAMVEHGFISEIQNSILVSVEDADAGRGEELKKKVSRLVGCAIETSTVGQMVGASVLSQTVDEGNDELAELAGEYGISLGKAALIEEVLSGADADADEDEEDGEDEDPPDEGPDGQAGSRTEAEPLTFSSMASMNVNDLALIASARDMQGNALTRTGRPSDRAYIGERAALERALTYAGVGMRDVRKEKVKLDCDKGFMVYDVKLKTARGTFKFCLNARTGEMARSKKGVYGAAVPAGANAAAARPQPVIPAAAQSAAVQEGRMDSMDAKDRSRMGMNAGNPNGYAQTDNGYSGGAAAYTTTAAGTVYNDPATGMSVPVPRGAVGEEAAKAAALAHAGLKESDCLYIYCHPEVDHGRMEHYDVKFVAGNMKYKYAIGIFDGAVLGRGVKDKSRKTGYVYEGNYHEHGAYGETYPLGAAPAGNGPAPAPAPLPAPQSAPAPAGAPDAAQGGMISEDAALSTALAATGLTLQNLEKWRIKLVTKHGRTVYRTKLKVRGMEYEIDVDAFTGAVTKSQQEIDY